jgi:hypothetical protein
MARKVLVFLVLAAMTAGSLFAQENTAPGNSPEKKKHALSAGAGVFAGGDFGGGAEAGSTEMKTPYFGGGGFAFFDAVYAELSLGFFAGSGKFKTSAADMDYSLTNFNIGLLGKYPVAFNEKLYLFPLLGLEYDICLSVDGADIDSMASASDWNTLWFKLGGGLDMPIAEKLYLRFEALYGIRLKTEFEKDLIDLLNIFNSDAKALLGHGLTAKLALGYKF